MVLDMDGRERTAMPRIRTLTLTVLHLVVLLGSSSALPQFSQAPAELDPVVVWAQPQTPASDRSDASHHPASDFQSRFGVFAEQSETAEPGSGSAAVWPGPAWERNPSQVASDRSGEVGQQEDEVSRESSRAADLASYVTRLTEQGFSSGDDLALQRPSTPRGQNGNVGDVSSGSDEEEAPKLSILRQRRKKLRRDRLRGASGPSRLTATRRQRPSVDRDVSEKSEDSINTSAASEREGAAGEATATEGPRQRRPFRTRRPQSSRRRPQLRRRPVKKATSQGDTSTTTTVNPLRRRRPTPPPTIATTTTTAAVRPVRRRRPTQPPTSSASTGTEQPTRISTAQAVYFPQNTQEYPQYPPFAPQGPTPTPEQPLQAPQLASQGPQETPQSAQQPTQFASSLQQFSESVRQLSNGQRADDDQDLSEKVSKFKLKLRSEKEVTHSEVPNPSVGNSVLPSFRAEPVTNRPLRELFDVLTRSELEKGSRRQNYGPVDRETSEPLTQTAAASSPFRAEVQRFQTQSPQIETDRPSLQRQRPEERPSPLQRRRPQLSLGSSSTDRVVPSKIEYESGFEPITRPSHFQVPSAPSSDGLQSSIPTSPPPQEPPSHGTFVSEERRPTTIQSQPHVTVPRPNRLQRPEQRPTRPVQRAPSRDEAPKSSGKVRFPGSAEPPKSPPSSPRPQLPPSGGRPRPGQNFGRPGPAPFGARPSDGKPPRDFVRPGAFGGPQQSGGFPGENRPSHEQGRPSHEQGRPSHEQGHPIHEQAQFSSGNRDSGPPRPPTGHPLGQQPFGGSHQSAPSQSFSGDNRRRPEPSQRPQLPRPFSSDSDNAFPQSEGIAGATPFPPTQEGLRRPPLNQRQNRPPPFRTQQNFGSSPQPFRRQPQQSGGRPHPNSLGRPSPRPFSKERPQRPSFNQLPTGSLSKARPQFPPPRPGQAPNGQFPLTDRPDTRLPPRQIAEESIQHNRPLAPPRRQRPGSFGQQRPPNDFQRRPSDVTGQQGHPAGQQRPHRRQPRPPFGFQQRPDSTEQKKPPFEFQQRPSESADQRRPPPDFQQRPPNGFQQRPDSTEQKKPPFEFQQRPSESADQQRPPPDFQQRPPNGFQQRPDSTEQKKPPFEFQQRPSESADQQRPPPDFQQRPPNGFQQRPPNGFQQRPPNGFQERPPNGFKQRPPTGFRQRPSGPGGFGQRVPIHRRPGSGLPGSAHPRKPSDGPLAELTRRRADQQAGQLQLVRG